MAKRVRVASKAGFFEAARDWRAADVAAMVRERSSPQARMSTPFKKSRTTARTFPRLRSGRRSCGAGTARSARFLLARGSDPNHCLHGLVYADDLGSAKLVRRYGAELDELGHGETPLIYAVRHQRARFAEWLLRQGADATLRDRRGFTALHHGVRRRLPSSTLRLLARRGADARAVAGSGATVASLATRMQRRLLGID
jgi:hypothetical protein